MVIVNERLAARFWPGADALGRRLQQWRGQAPIGRPVEIVGIARDSQYATLGEAPRANVYRPLTQDHQSGVAVLVAAHGDPAGCGRTWIAQFNSWTRMSRSSMSGR